MSVSDVNGQHVANFTNFTNWYTSVFQTYPLIGYLSFGNTDSICAHSCFSQNIYALFVHDGEFGHDTGDISSDEDTSQWTTRPNHPCLPVLSLNVLSQAPDSHQLPGQNISLSLTTAPATARPSLSEITVPFQQNSSLFLNDIPAAMDHWVGTNWRQSYWPLFCQNVAQGCVWCHESQCYVEQPWGWWSRYRESCYQVQSNAHWCSG